MHPHCCVAYQQKFITLGMTPSLSRKGNCYDNVAAESFFSIVKNELVHHQIYHTQIAESLEIFGFIEGSYLIASGCISAVAIQVRWSSNVESVGLNLVSTKPGPAQGDPNCSLEKQDDHSINSYDLIATCAFVYSPRIQIIKVNFNPSEHSLDHMLYLSNMP